MDQYSQVLKIESTASDFSDTNNKYDFTKYFASCPKNEFITLFQSGEHRLELMLHFRGYVNNICSRLLKDQSNHFKVFF